VTVEPADDRPWLVMVTGAPGSGKTSLGLQLAGALRVPFLSRDDVRGGLQATAGMWTNQVHTPSPREAAVEAFVQIVETSVSLGVSAVLEFIVTPDRADGWRRLQAAANCLVVLAECTEARNRADSRDRDDLLLNRPSVLEALGHDSIKNYIRGPERDLVRVGMQTEFDLPLLRVVTDDGYEPPLPDIIDWVIDQTRR
jgi:predicted kinase